MTTTFRQKNRNRKKKPKINIINFILRKNFIFVCICNKILLLVHLVESDIENIHCIKIYRKHTQKKTHLCDLMAPNNGV